jgi:hypothetical protein
MNVDHGHTQSPVAYSDIHNAFGTVEVRSDSLSKVLHARFRPSVSTGLINVYASQLPLKELFSGVIYKNRTKLDI